MMGIKPKSKYESLSFVNKVNTVGSLTVVDAELDSVDGFFINEDEDRQLLVVNSNLPEERRNEVIEEYKSQPDNFKKLYEAIG